MKKLFVLLLIVILSAACDDGDMIVTGFDFDSSNELHRCNANTTQTLYVVNNEPPEAISFTFSDENFDGTFEGDDEEQSQILSLDQGSKLTYRTFDETINGNDYFCSGTPPTSPKVKEEYENEEGGEMELLITVIDEELLEEENQIKKTFETRLIAHDVTLKKVGEEEEIVTETLKLGSFTKTKTFEVE